MLVSKRSRAPASTTAVSTDTPAVSTLRDCSPASRLRLVTVLYLAGGVAASVTTVPAGMVIRPPVSVLRLNLASTSGCRAGSRSTPISATTLSSAPPSAVSTNAER